MLIKTHLKCNKCSQRLYYDVYAADVRGNAAHTCYKKRINIANKDKTFRHTPNSIFFNPRNSNTTSNTNNQNTHWHNPQRTTTFSRQARVSGSPRACVRPCVGWKGKLDSADDHIPSGSCCRRTQPTRQVRRVVFFFITLTEVWVISTAGQSLDRTVDVGSH